MLEAQLAYYLNRYLGTYVEGLNQRDLKVSVFRGDVVLKNLKLKPEALADLNLPISVKAGLLGSLTLKVTSLRPHAWQSPWPGVPFGNAKPLVVIFWPIANTSCLANLHQGTFCALPLGMVLRPCDCLLLCKVMLRLFDTVICHVVS